MFFISRSLHQGLGQMKPGAPPGVTPNPYLPYPSSGGDPPWPGYPRYIASSITNSRKWPQTNRLICRICQSAPRVEEQHAAAQRLDQQHRSAQRVELEHEQPPSGWNLKSPYSAVRVEEQCCICHQAGPATFSFPRDGPSNN